MRSIPAKTPDLRPLTAQEAKRSLLMAAIGAATILASFVYAPWSENGPVLCASRFFLGLPCPGCGLTRSFCAIARGDLGHAMAFHVLGPVLFAGLVVGVPLLLIQAITRRPIRLLNTTLFSRRLAFAGAIILATFHAVRLVGMAWSGSLWTGMAHSTLGTAVRWMLG